MQVSRIMSKNVVTLPVTADLNEAMRLMKEYDIRHLPVVEDGRLVGLVTERDVRGALFPSMIEEISVQDLMITNPITVSPETRLEDAARLVYRRKIGCLPVVDEGRRLVGIVTVADMLAALIELMGFISASSRLDVVLPDRPEALEEALRIIQRNGGQVISVSQTSLCTKKPVHLFRLQKTDLNPIVEAMKEVGFSVVSSLE
ncbi:MAG: CBS and ACT domain-containing protein [Thermodesulfobacteriota bacterium]